MRIAAKLISATRRPIYILLLAIKCWSHLWKWIEQLYTFFEINWVLGEKALNRSKSVDASGERRRSWVRFAHEFSPSRLHTGDIFHFAIRSLTTREL